MKPSVKTAGDYGNFGRVECVPLAEDVKCPPGAVPKYVNFRVECVSLNSVGNAKCPDGKVPEYAASGVMLRCKDKKSPRPLNNATIKEPVSCGNGTYADSIEDCEGGGTATPTGGGGTDEKTGVEKTAEAKSSDDAARRLEEICAAYPEVEECRGGISAGSMVDDDFDVSMEASIYESRVEQCRIDRKRAEQCCNNPVQCLDSESDIGVTDMTLISAVLTGGAAMMSSSSLAASCGMAEKMGYTATALNSGMAAACNFKKNQCEASCGDLKDELLAAKDECRTQACRSKFNRLIARTGGACREFQANITALSSQAVQGILSAQLAAQCKKAAKAMHTGFDEIDVLPVFNGDCSDPANFSNPFCQGNCNRPGAENDPLCRANSATDSIGLSNQRLGEFGNRGTPNVDFGDDVTQAAVTGGGELTENKNNGVPSNGGGFAGGGGNPSFGGGGGGGGAGGGGGYDTNILKGLSGGNGYSVSGAGTPTGGGGFRGYGSNGGSERGGSKFDLTKYLPQREVAANRKIAGMAALGPGAEIGGSHEDIWQRISKRYYNLCVSDRLLDCKSNLKGMKKQFGH